MAGRRPDHLDQGAREVHVLLSAAWSLRSGRQEGLSTKFSYLTGGLVKKIRAPTKASERLRHLLWLPGQGDQSACQGLSDLLHLLISVL